MPKLFNNFNEAFDAWLRRRGFEDEAENRKMLGTARKRAKAMNTKKRKDTNGNDTNETKENQT